MFGNTEVFAFGYHGKADLYGETGSEMLGKMRIWEVLEERYLPPFRPSFIPADIPDDQIVAYAEYEPKRITAGYGDRERALKEIFALVSSDKLSRNEKVVLASTFDQVVVEKCFLPRVIEALRTFTDEHNDNLLAQAALLEKALNDPHVWGIGWNQSSMHSDRWDAYIPYKSGEHEEWRAADANDEGICYVREPYDMNRDTTHWDMAFALNELPVGENEVKYLVQYAIFPLRAVYYGKIILPKELDSEQVEAEIQKEFHKQGFRLQKLTAMENVS